MPSAFLPYGTIFTPPGMVSQKPAAAAVGEVMMSTGAPKVEPPSVEEATHTAPGAQSWYSMATTACLVVFLGGMAASTHCRSTRNGWPLELVDSSADRACSGQVLPRS